MNLFYRQKKEQVVVKTMGKIYSSTMYTMKEHVYIYEHQYTLFIRMIYHNQFLLLPLLRLKTLHASRYSDL